VIITENIKNVLYSVILSTYASHGRHRCKQESSSKRTTRFF